MEIMTVKETCQFLRIGQTTLHKLIRQGLPCHQRQKGSKILFNKRELERWWYQYHNPNLEQKLERLRLMKR